MRLPMKGLTILALLLWFVGACVAVNAQTPGKDSPWAYPKHIELSFLEHGRKVFLVESGDDASLSLDPKLRYEAFRVDDHRMVYVIAGTGSVKYGKHEIGATTDGLLIDGKPLGPNVYRAVVTAGGEVVPNAFIR